MSQEKLDMIDKSTLENAIAFYYNNYVWKDLVTKNNSLASSEDFKLRNVINKLELKMPDTIRSRQ